MGTRLYKTVAAALGLLIGPACGSDGGGTSSGGTTAGGGGSGATTASGGTGGGISSGGNVAEYGMPYARFVASGTVADSVTGDPIEGIEVSVESGWAPAVSDAQGRWQLDAEGDPFCLPECDLTATDVDGATNGAYQDATVAATFEQTVQGSGWDEGTWEAQGVEIEIDEVE